MEINVLEAKDTKFVFETEYVNHALFNALKMELWENKDLHVAGYHVTHPLVGKARWQVEMKKGDARKAFETALKNIQKQFSDAAKQAAKL